MVNNEYTEIRIGGEIVSCKASYMNLQANSQPMAMYEILSESFTGSQMNMTMWGYCHNMPSS